jgi:polyphosphate:AMP phosphotransferase
MGWLPKQTERPDLPKGEYRQRVRSLRLALLEAQTRLREVDGALVVLVAGVDGAGKGESVNLLNEWLDPRWIRTRAFDGPSDEERERPAYWRYWRSLPPYGAMTLFLSAWYSEPLIRRAHGADDTWFETRLEEIRRFERTLVLGGISVLKLWLHLDQQAQQDRLQQLSRDPLRSWRVAPLDWENCAHYDAFASATEEILDATHTRSAPWNVIDGSDARRRSLEVGDAVLRTLRLRFERDGGSAADAPPPRDLDAEPEIPRRSGQEARVSKAVYRKEVDRLRAEIGRLHREARNRGVPMIAVFEGRDAAGKGGAIRRLVPSLDARRVDVVRIGPPTHEERTHHYLWRFWQRLPRSGHVTLFDRSWYGRVLVERVEGLAAPEEWQRAYDEINDFEHQIVEHGTVLVKFWLDVTREEQERRFEERRRVTHKRWKLTEEDLRNRENWDAYGEAIAAMLARTNPPSAPWTVIQADDKRHARLEVLQRTAAALRERLGDEQRT